MMGSIGKNIIGQIHAEDMDLIQLHEAEVRATGRMDLEAWSLSRPSNLRGDRD
jgi:hypothetical protein